MAQHAKLPIKVLMMPDYRVDNPYQALLTEALQQEEVEVYFPSGYRRVLPIYRASKDCCVPVQILHLHWINPYLKGLTWLERYIYSLKFLMDIFLVRVAGIKVVWTIHNRLSHEAQFSSLELWTIRQLVKLADRIIVHHQATVLELSELYQFDLEKATVIPHGHYRGVYGEAVPSLKAREILGLPRTGKLYLTLGMLRPYKGIERLLEIWKGNLKATSEYVLLIAGKPLNEAYGQQLSAQIAGRKDILLHLGFVESYLIPYYFSAADVVILPFENVLTSGSLILAMSYDKPVIVPSYNSLNETLGQANWLLYDSGAQQEILKAIESSTKVNLIALSKLVKNACDLLDWSFIGQKTCQLYQAMM